MSFKTTILNALGSLGKFLSILFQDALKKELEVVLPLALGAVRAVAADPTLVHAGAKREVAVALILAQLGKAQIEVGLSVVNLGLELAVQNIKSTNITQANIDQTTIVPKGV